MQVVPLEKLWGSDQSHISFTPVMLVSLEWLQVQTRIIQANRGFCFRPLEGKHPEMDEPKWITSCSHFFQALESHSLKSEIPASPVWDELPPGVPRCQDGICLSCHCWDVLLIGLQTLTALTPCRPIIHFFKFYRGEVSLCRPGEGFQTQPHFLAAASDGLMSNTFEII